MPTDKTARSFIVARDGTSWHRAPY